MLKNFDLFMKFLCWENGVLPLVSEQVCLSGQVVESRCVVLQFCTVFKSYLSLCVVQRTKMAKRNDAAIAAALEVVAQAGGQQHNANVGANAEVRMLETFLRNHPLLSKEGMTLMELKRGSKRLRESSVLYNVRKIRICVLVCTCWMRKLMTGG
jgi:hypothetical protein